jgi:flagellar protein FlbD
MFFLNPDLIERVDTHVDTVIRLTSGTEYVVVETGDEIVRRTGEFRAQILALAAYLQGRAFENQSEQSTEPAVAMLEEWAEAAEPFTTAQDDVEPYGDDVPSADDIETHDIETHDIASGADQSPGIEEETVR